MKLDSKIEEILSKYKESDLGRLETFIDYKRAKNQPIKKLKLLLIETMLEVVGEDDKVPWKQTERGVETELLPLARNQFRAEIRERIKDL